MNNGHDQSRARRGFRLAAAALLGAAVVLPPVVATAQTVADQTEAQRQTRIREDARELCTLIRKAIAKLPPTVSVEDAEAAIVYALSQANPRYEIIDPALACAAAGATGNIAQAIANVRASYARRGTGAIDNGGGGRNTVSVFSPPVVGIGGGGGGSNYTQD